MMRSWIALLGVLCAALWLPAWAAIDAQTGVVTDERLDSGVPFGGIGTGKVELLTDGTFGNLTLNNNWDRPIASLPGSFFAVRTRVGTKAEAKVLASRSPYGLPTVAGVRYEGLFPRANVDYSDPALPVGVSLNATSILHPRNLKDSSLPAALFTFTLTNPGKEPVDAAVAFSWENVLGVGGNARIKWDDRTGNTQTLKSEGSRAGLVFSTGKKEGERQNSDGEYALVVEAPGGKYDMTPNWNAADDGRVLWGQFAGGMNQAGTPLAKGESRPAGAVWASVTVPPGGAQQVHFTLAWRLPKFVLGDGADLGHAYSKNYPDAWSVASYVSQYRDTLLSGTTDWQDLMLKSSLPAWLKRKLLNDASALVSNSILTADGRFALIESTADGEGGLGAMDQWLLSRGPLEAFFPALGHNELSAFTSAQLASGDVPRRLGTLNDGFTQPKDGAPAAGAPDIACQYVLAVYGRHRATGDLEALKAAFPSVQKALDYVRSRDADGDGLPEGASQWGGAETAGASSYVAGLYLAALRAGEEMARLAAPKAKISEKLTDKTYLDELDDRFRSARSSAMAMFWNGRYFAKSLDPQTGERSSNVTANALAGEWAAEALDLKDIYPRRAVETALQTALDLLSAPGSQLPANEATYDGDGAVAASDSAWSGAVQTYLASLAVAQGSADGGLEVVRRFHESQERLSRSPWDGAIAYNPRTGQRLGARGHATTMGSWNVYSALTGFHADEGTGRLTIAPRLPSTWGGLHAPVFSGRYLAWMDYARTPLNDSGNLRIKLLKNYDQNPVRLTAVSTNLPTGAALEDLTLIVSGPAGAIEGKAETSGGRINYTFKMPFEWRQGETLEWTLVPPEANNLLVNFDTKKVLTLGSVVTAKDLERDKQAKFTLVNPTDERQVVNVRFRGIEDRSHQVYQNGTQLPRFTPDSDEERLTIAVPASPVSVERIEALRRAHLRLTSARESAQAKGMLAKLEAPIDGLRTKITAAIQADEKSRSTQIVMIPTGTKILGTNIIRKRIKETPAVVMADDPEPAVAAAEAALADAPKAAESIETVSDKGAARSVFLGAVSPITVDVSTPDTLEPDGLLRLRVYVRNDSRRTAQATVSLELPADWKGSSQTGALTIPAGETVVSVLAVRLPATLTLKRYAVGGTAIVIVDGVGWATPVRGRVGAGPIRDWQISGIVPATSVDQSLPSDADAAEAKGFNAVSAVDGAVDLAAQFTEQERGVVYAVTDITVSKEQDAFLELDTRSPVFVTVGGTGVFQRKAVGSGGTERIPVRLKAGKNRLVLKLFRTSDQWAFGAEVVDAEGGTPE